MKGEGGPLNQSERSSEKRKWPGVRVFNRRACQHIDRYVIAIVFEEAGDKARLI